MIHKVHIILSKVCNYLRQKYALTVVDENYDGSKIAIASKHKVWFGPSIFFFLVIMIWSFGVQWSCQYERLSLCLFWWLMSAFDFASTASLLCPWLFTKIILFQYIHRDNMRSKVANMLDFFYLLTYSIYFTTYTSNIYCYSITPNSEISVQKVSSPFSQSKQSWSADRYINHDQAYLTANHLKAHIGFPSHRSGKYSSSNKSL